MYLNIYEKPLLSHRQQIGEYLSNCLIPCAAHCPNSKFGWLAASNVQVYAVCANGHQLLHQMFSEGNTWDTCTWRSNYTRRKRRQKPWVGCQNSRRGHVFPFSLLSFRTHVWRWAAPPEARASAGGRGLRDLQESISFGWNCVKIAPLEFDGLFL